MNERLEGIQLNPVRYYSRLIKKDQKGIDLTMGEGHFDSPFQAKMKAYEALVKNNTKYSNLDGDVLLKELLIEKYYPMYNPINEIIITNGSTQGLYSVILSIVNNVDDEVIIVSPYYPAYEHVVKLMGSKCVIVDTSTTNFKLNKEQLEKAITPHTKAIIVNEPCNPTGVTYTKEEKLALLDFFLHYNFLVIIDELYRLFTPNDFVSFSQLIDDDLKERFIFINGLSKSHMMTGYRIGYVISNPKINLLLRKVNYLSISCVSTVMQQAAIGAISEDEYCQFTKNYYLNNVKILKDALNELEIDYVKADSGYYIFMNISKFSQSDEAFCLELLNKYNVAVVPGSLFGNVNKEYIRVSCCKDVKDIVDFIDVLMKLRD